MDAPNDDRRRVLDWLGDHDEPCPACGYSLQGLEGTICPECGAALTLSVSSPNASPGPWALAVISFALALGFDAVVTIGMSVQIARFGAPLFPVGLIYIVFAALTLVMAIGLFWTIRHRTAWTRRARSRQWRISRLVFLGVGTAHAAFGLMLASNLS